MPLHVSKPEPGDYSPHHEPYIRLVPTEGDHLAVYAAQEADVVAVYRQLTEEQAAYRYADGKWSLKQLLGHMSDAERIMTYRLLSIARGDTTSLPGFDEDAYVSGASFDSRLVGDLLGEYQAVRQATTVLLRSLTALQLQRAGTVNNNRVTAAALVYVVVGHGMHHMNLVRERYAPGIR